MNSPPAPPGQPDDARRRTGETEMEFSHPVKYTSPAKECNIDGDNASMPFDVKQSAANNDSGYLDGSMADEESDNECDRSSFVDGIASGSFDEGFDSGAIQISKAESTGGETTVGGGACQSTDYCSDPAGGPPKVLIKCRRRDDNVPRTVTQEQFRRLAPEEAAFCYITLYDSEWRNLRRRKEQAARESANSALDVAYTRDEAGKRPGFSAMFGADWDREAVYQVWKDIKRSVPRADPLERVLNWVLSDDVRKYAPDEVGEYEKAFLDLPERGKHFPNPNPAMSIAVIEGYETSISRCASERGTHGHNSPVPVDPHGQKILDIYKELHRRQAHVKDQIVHGTITAETLEKQMELQPEEDNTSELVHALDHYLALRRACRTFYAVEQMNNDAMVQRGGGGDGRPLAAGQYDARHAYHHQVFVQQQQQQQQLQAMVAGQSHYHHQQQLQQQHPQPHHTQMPPGHHYHQQPVPHHQHQQHQQHGLPRRYPVHVTNPTPFHSQGEPPVANGVYLPCMPQPAYALETKKVYMPSALGNTGPIDGNYRHPAMLVPMKNNRRHKKTTQPPPPPARQLRNRSGSFYTLPYQCQWQRCGHRFKSSQELYTHVERQHILTDPGLLTGERGFSCQWHGCSGPESGPPCALASPSTHNLAAGGLAASKAALGKGRLANGNASRLGGTQRKTSSFKARYQLLIHIQSMHCKEKAKLEQQITTSGFLPSTRDRQAEEGDQPPDFTGT